MMTSSNGIFSALLAICMGNSPVNTLLVPNSILLPIIHERGGGGGGKLAFQRYTTSLLKVWTRSAPGGYIDFRHEYDPKRCKRLYHDQVQLGLCQSRIASSNLHWRIHDDLKSDALGGYRQPFPSGLNILPIPFMKGQPALFSLRQKDLVSV